MLRTIEAIIEPDGSVHLLQTVALPGTRRALITVLEESADEAAGDLTAPLSEPMLTQEWDRPEEDAAWAHLQPGA